MWRKLKDVKNILGYRLSILSQLVVGKTPKNALYCINYIPTQHLDNSLEGLSRTLENVCMKCIGYWLYLFGLIRKLDKDCIGCIETYRLYLFGHHRMLNKDCIKSIEAIDYIFLLVLFEHLTKTARSVLNILTTSFWSQSNTWRRLHWAYCNYWLYIL